MPFRYKLLWIPLWCAILSEAQTAPPQSNEKTNGASPAELDSGRLVISPGNPTPNTNPPTPQDNGATVFHLRCSTATGHLFKIQCSDSPLWTNPIDLTDFAPATGDDHELQITVPAGSDLQFYRVVQQAQNDSPRLITVRAGGRQGSEKIDLIINGTRVASWPMTTIFQTFTHTTSEPIETLRIRYESGSWPNAVLVDYIELNGIRYESEDPTTRSEGSWHEENGCTNGFAETEWLSCDEGYFDYALIRPGEATPIVIYDTDMGPDIDDAVTLAMLHAYQDVGMIELAAVTLSRDALIAARYIDVINTTYGRPDIPIGIYRGGTVNAVQVNNNRFTVLAPNYPHDVHESPIENGYDIIRRVLANAGGRPVLVIQTGFSGTLSALLNSGADEHSPLSGQALVADTVDSLHLVGGRFGTQVVEFNILHDLASAKNLFQKWPGKIVVSDWQVGADLIYPYDRGIRDRLPANHPVRAAYEQRVLDWHRRIDPNPPRQFYNMVSWDLTTVVEAIEPDEEYFRLSPPGTVTLSAQGVTTFVENPQGKHTLMYSPPDRARTINRMIELVR